jgi:Transposase, Mutator family
VRFLAYDVKVRRVVRSTNVIESLNARVRRAVTSSGAIPHRVGCPKMPLRRIASPGPDRARRGTMDHPLEASPPLSLSRIPYLAGAYADGRPHLTDRCEPSGPRVDVTS